MKILHITPTIYPDVGGIETVVRDLMRNLRHKGFVADALHIAVGNRRMRDQLDDSLVWRMPLFPHRLIGVVPSIQPIIREYDILHVHDPHLMALSLNALLRAHGKPIVLSTHGGYRHTSRHSSIKAIHWKFLAPSILNQYDEVLASSHSDWEFFKAKAPRIKLVPNGVNIERFLSIGRAADTNPMRWIYWGRLSKNKRLDIVIDSVAQAHLSGLSIDLLIVGSDFDGLLPSLRARVDQYALQAHIRFAGQLSDTELLKEIATRSVFISASEHEGFGLSIIEAMAAGMIVICRDMPPLNAFVSPGRNGVLLKFDRSASDLSLIRGLCSAPADKLCEMRRNARNAAGQYSWDAVIGQYIDVYTRLSAVHKI
jgi:alpha-1,3-mannosyltransferase